MTEAETPPTTPQAIAQAGRYTTNVGRQSPIATRRSVLAFTPLAALAAVMPTATLGALGADQAIVALCNQHLANRDAFNASPQDAGDGNPEWNAYRATDRAISEAKPMTLSGLAAKARAAKVDDEEKWAWDLVNDLIRLGGVA